MPYIWESKDWPHFRWDAEIVYANSYHYALNASRLAHETRPLSEPKRRDGPAGLQESMSAKRHMRFAGCSKATATRDLPALVRTGALKRLPGGGRSTRYAIWLPETSNAPPPLQAPWASGARDAKHGSDLR